MAAVASAHIIISYPGWRGNNLITNETHPYGMQWEFPCKAPVPNHRRLRMLISLQVVALVPPRIVHTGLQPAVLSHSSLAGSAATRRHLYMSIWALEPMVPIMVPSTWRTPWSHPSRSLAPQMDPTLGPSASLRSHCPRMLRSRPATSQLFKSLSWPSTVRPCTR